MLTMVTCGIYLFYWQYVTTTELKNVSGRDDLNPAMDLALSLLCCGAWSIYVQYRNTQVVPEVLARRGMQHEDRSMFVLLMHVITLVSGGITGLFAMMIVQDELNKLADGQQTF